MSNDRYAKAEAGVGQKPDDSWAVPLCNKCHRDQHKAGELVFWGTWADPFILALALWQATGDYERGLTIIRNAR